MKKLFTLLFATLALTSMNAQLLVEDFTASGALLGTNSWIATSPASTVNPLTTTTGLTYAGYDGSGVGNAIAMQNTGEDLTKAFSSQTSGSIYVTFMLNVSAATTTTGAYITGLTSTTTTTYNLRFFVKAATNGIDFGVSRSSGTPAVFTGNTYNLNQTYLITCKYTFGTAAAFDDIASIYVHPTTSLLVEPSVMSASFSGGTTGADATNIASIYLRQGTAADNVVAVIDGFRVATTWASTIPVEMVSFTAKKAGTTNKLAWQTATELNNQHFDVQRSTDGATFQSIGQVKGVGNSVALNNYEYVDETPALGTNYYRLQQVDYDGKTTMSKTVAVSTTGKGSAKVFPTLATDKINVLTTSDKEEMFTITNMVGQTVLTGRVVNSLDINVSQLAKGIYILRVADDAVKFSKQ